MAAHVTKSAGAEIKPLAPVDRVIIALANERTLGRHAKPKVPIESAGDRIGSIRW